jgi:hypothetical protein
VSQLDLIQEHVNHYLKRHPGAECKIQRKSEGEYIIHGRDVKVQLYFGANTSLLVQDGPLRQPFDDYMQGEEASAVYRQPGLNESCLNQVPKDARLSFADDGETFFSRVESMAIAKEQALVREKAASYVKQGRTVPSSLMDDYEKTIDLKLGRPCRKSCIEPVAPAWWSSLKNQREAQGSSTNPQQTKNDLTSSAQEGTASVPYPRQEKSPLVRDGAASVPYPRQQQTLAVRTPPVPRLGGIPGAIAGPGSPRPLLQGLPVASWHLSPRPHVVRAQSPSTQPVALVPSMARKVATPRVHQTLRPAAWLGGA